MKFYTKQHKHYCGIDLHAKKMYVCIINQENEIVLHKNIDTNPDTFMSIIQPFRRDIVVGVECMFTWYWRDPKPCHSLWSRRYQQIFKGTRFCFVLQVSQKHRESNGKLYQYSPMNSEEPSLSCSKISSPSIRKSYWFFTGEGGVTRQHNWSLRVQAQSSSATLFHCSWEYTRSRLCPLTEPENNWTSRTCDDSFVLNGTVWGYGVVSWLYLNKIQLVVEQVFEAAQLLVKPQ